MIPSTPSPSKKHYSTQHKDEQDAAERVWIRDVLERNSNPPAPGTSSTEVQLQLQLQLRNVGSRVRKSVSSATRQTVRFSLFRVYYVLQA